MEKYDFAVIGAGPGGYVSAIRAAQLGLRVALVEKDDRLGGTCLNVGCIPSKALLESSERYAAAGHRLNEHGIEIGSIKLDLKRMMARKQKVVETLTDGVATLMKKNRVQVIRGTGRLTSANRIAVVNDERLTE
ncbi:MAG TPA: NAD(P)/FAD-dependent oxidoreductase, partial [Bacteroidetes bacterium]|nr:NAD(P)/FAD-dependent oxidoreductase [Bacteroidota bacterium]